MIPLIVIRPLPGAGTTAAAARALGLDPRIFPLFEVGPVAWDAPDPVEIDALLIGSANAIRHAGPALVGFRDKPVHAVGQATAAAARDAGLTVAAAGTGGLEGVLAQVSAPARLLRLAGREHVDLTVPPGITLTERIVYASEPRPVEPELALLLQGRAVVLLHSAIAATHFAAECDRLAVDRSLVALATIGPRVTGASGRGWAALATAVTPDDVALLAQAHQLCQNHDRSPPSGTQ